ncbi:MAG: hypothetical protein IKJ94_01125 [Oscillospiraceae bacterium]|nr:hypothetical protein [Oscillospiraceae bacterium]
MEMVSLNGTWQLRGRRQEGEPSAELTLTAKVPGCAQLDLSQAGYLPADLFMGENILETQKYEDFEWWYTRTFTAPETKENVYLVFEGVDCVAEYFLNGVLIGESQNMMISHEFAVDNLLRDGKNTLTIHIKSPVIASHYENYTVTSMMAWGNAPVETGIRRAPHSYGWDIMPRAVTSGIWRDVRLEIRDKLRFSQLFFNTTQTSCTLLYEVESKWSDFKNVEIEAVGHCGDSSFSVRRPLISGKAGRFSIPIKNPKVWWPYGYGEANIYDVVVRLYSCGELIHEEPAAFGLRTVKLDRTDATDEHNGQFRFLINDVEIMCKGSNWVPLDAFHCRDAERYDEALALVKDIGCNILRCWGGNVYEDHKFYDFCDRNGIMVWQDFAMACRIYPETEKFLKQIKEEVTWVVRRRRNHPSIILWAGDNEIDQVISSFANPSINHITREIIPRIIEQNDVGRPYLPSSPYISEKMYVAGFRAQKHGSPLVEDHLWGPRDYFKSDFYRCNKAHFVSETGYHGCPSLESIKKFITAEKVWPYQNNSEWILHSSNQTGNDGRVMLMENQVRQLFGTVPTDPEDYILASQISQAEAKKYFIERMRVGRPQKNGIIWWNLLDGWPQMSDAVVDYYFTKKLAYGYIKRSQAPFCIIADEISNWKIKIFACNDTLQLKNGHCIITDAETKQVLLDKDFTANKNTSTCIGEIPVYYSDHKFLSIQWDINGETGYNHYLCGYPPLDLAWYKKLIGELGL